MNTRGGKRRRSLCSSSPIQDENECIAVEGYTLESLPPEVFEMILRLLPFRDVAGSIRLVSRRCSTIAMAVLNGAFIAAGIRLETTINYIKGRTAIGPVPTTNPNMDEPTSSEACSNLLAWSKLLYVLQLIKAQYKMLKAVTWRYTDPPKWAKFNRVCFYAGSLLDELNGILDVARLGPESLLSSSGPSSPPPRVLSFIALCKRFMNYFEKVSEYRALNRSAMISGCKAVDILDCLAEGRQVMSFRMSSTKRLASLKKIKAPHRNETGARYESRIITMRLRYVMRRAWFTCLQVPHAPDENSWREDQSFMYLRLRRLVGSVNEHYFEKAHFERDLLVLRRPHTYRSVISRILPHRSLTRRPPPGSIYSGYGVYAGRFFYYGNMNKYAYENKFKDANDRTTNVDSSDESGRDDDDDDDDDEHQDNESERPNDISSSFRNDSRAFDLVILVELRCSSDLAPLAVISSLRTSDLDDHSISHGNSELYLKLNITCPASSANRLPANFTWELRDPAATHSRSKRPRFSN